MSSVFTTGESDIGGYSLALKGKELTDKPVATSDLLHLGGNSMIQRPYRKLLGLNHPSSLVTKTSEFSSKIRDDEINQNLNFGGCTYSQVVVTQKGSYLADGTPMFQVSVINNCLTCAMQNVHIACGDFASAVAVDPAIFKKLDYNDCILNNGYPIAPMTLLYFEYASSFSYPMQVSVGGACSCS